MKCFLVATLLLSSLVGSLHAQLNSEDRVSFDNRSSETLFVYRSPISASSRPVKRLAPGESFTTRTTRDDRWVVSTPVWNRLVGTIRPGDGGWNRRLVIRNSDVNALGRQPVRTTFDNRSRIPIKVHIVVDGTELDWLWIGAGSSTWTTSFEGQEWVARAQSDGRFLQRAYPQRRPSTVTIVGRRPGGGAGGGHGRPPGIDYPPPVPDQVNKVNVKFINETSQPVYIYKAKDGEWKYNKRIYAGREYVLEFEVGQPISIRHPWSGDEIERLHAPSRDTTHRIGKGRGKGRPPRR
jgi:hypothetical protein